MSEVKFTKDAVMPELMLAGSREWGQRGGVLSITSPRYVSRPAHNLDASFDHIPRRHSVPSTHDKSKVGGELKTSRCSVSLAIWRPRSRLVAKPRNAQTVFQ